MWSKIDHTIKVVKKQQIKAKKNLYRKVWFKVAASISVILVIFIIIGSAAGTGETFPFLFPFHRLVQQIINSTQLLFQFDLKKEQHIPDDVTLPPSGLDTDNEEMPVQVGFIDSDLETLKSIYPGILFYPDIIPVDSLKKIQYLNYDYLWIINMDIDFEGFDVVLTQEDVPMGGVSGKGYDRDDAKVSFYRSGGVEYMIVEDRYNIVKITWFMKDKLFYLSANIPVETALEIAQSVEPMIFDSN